MRRFVVLTLALVLLAACTKPLAPGSPEVSARQPEVTSVQPGQESGPQPTPAQPGPASGPGDPAPNEADIPVPGAMPEGMRRVELAAGQSITEPGLYYMDVATGKLEGWLMPPYDWQRAMQWVQTTPDHRWLTFGLDGQSYLIRRSDAKVFRYNPERIRVTPGPGLFLLQPPSYDGGDSARFTLVDEEMQVVSTFAMNTYAPGNVHALFSPDGKRLALADGSSNGGLSLVDVPTGTVTRLADPSGESSVNLVALPKPGEFVAIHGRYQEPLRLKRYNWQGELVGQKQVDGWTASISTDGRTLAIAQSMGSYGQAVAMMEWQAEEPFLRVAGALGPSWLAGGGEMVVSTSQGWQLVTRSGEMQPAPGGGEPRWQHFGWYLPSPDTADLFLTGTKVIDRAGRVVHSTQIADRAQARMLSAAWGPASREVQLVVIPPLGKGFDVEPWTYFLPRVQRPPFPAEYPLQVQDPGGQCLNLREEPSLQGRIVRCLPTGTRLAIALTRDGNVSTASEERLFWLAMEVETGEKGWVAINTGSIAYADH